MDVAGARIDEEDQVARGLEGDVANGNVPVVGDDAARGKLVEGRALNVETRFVGSILHINIDDGANSLLGRVVRISPASVVEAWQKSGLNSKFFRLSHLMRTDCEWNPDTDQYVVREGASLNGRYQTCWRQRP